MRHYSSNEYHFKTETLEAMNYEPGILSHKIKTASWALSIALVLIIGRLVHLQIILQNNFYTKSQKNFLRIETIPPLRGNILDRNDKLLATNRPTTNIFWEGTGQAKVNPDQIKTLEILETITGKPMLCDEELLNQLNMLNAIIKNY